MKKFLIIFVFVPVVFLGCGEDQKTGGATKQQTASKSPVPEKKKTKIEKKKEEKKEEEKEKEYSYNPEGKRNPFASLFDVKKPVEPVREEPLTPLERFGLEQFRLLGAIVGIGEPRAMIAAPDGKSYVVTPGTRIGKNRGEVVKITSEGVFVEERYYDYTGEVRKNIRVIELPEEEGE